MLCVGDDRVGMRNGAVVVVVTAEVEVVADIMTADGELFLKIIIIIEINYYHQSINIVYFSSYRRSASRSRR